MGLCFLLVFLLQIFNLFSCDFWCSDAVIRFFIDVEQHGKVFLWWEKIVIMFFLIYVQIIDVFKIRGWDFIDLHKKSILFRSCIYGISQIIATVSIPELWQMSKQLIMIDLAPFDDAPLIAHPLAVHFTSFHKRLTHNNYRH